MPVSKNRRKNGKRAKNSAQKRAQRLEEAPSGVTLQDLINVLAYQEYVKDGIIVPEEPKIDFEDPDTQAIIRAVDTASTTEEN